MEPITWVTVAGLLIKYGEPFVEHLIANWQNGVPVTPETFAELRKKGERKASDIVSEMLVSKGVALDSDEAKAFLKLVA